MTVLAPEGEYTAELKEVSYKNENKKCILHFETELEGNKHTVQKESPTSFDTGGLRKDLELLNGSEFTTKQVEEGIEPESFVGHKCRAYVVHKRTSGGRVVAVGSTSVRTLETVAAAHDGRVVAGSGRTEIFIRPPFAFRAVDALLTNFHLPRSTLLAMVAAFAGRERVLAAYREAIAQRYRFFSYGDCMLIV